MLPILALGLIAFLISLIITPLIRDAFAHVGLVDRPDNGRKLHPRPIPRVGGIVIAISYAAAFAIVLSLPFASDAVRDVIPSFWAFVPAAELIFITGLLDDIVCLRPWQKLSGQLVAALIAWYAGVRIEVLGSYVLDPTVSVIVTVLWLIACTNAFNLIDGMDGLATGVGLFATMTVLVAALTHQSLDLVVVTVPLIGCLLAFLRYNFNPASVFLGDSGSLLIGFLLGCFGALWAHKSATLLGMTAPLMAVAIPLLDASLAVVRRFLRNKSLFAGDRGHIHHRLLDRGLSPRQAALIIYGISGLAAIFSLVQDSFEHHFGGIIIVLFCTTAWIGIQHLGYVEFGVARQMFIKGSFRRLIDTHTNLAAFEAKLSQARDVDELWPLICQTAKEMGFHAVDLRTTLLSRGYDNGCASAEWEARVSFESGYIIFRRELVAGLDTLPVGTFISIVRVALDKMLAREQVVAPVHEVSVCSAALD